MIVIKDFRFYSCYLTACIGHFSLTNQLTGGNRLKVRHLDLDGGTGFIFIQTKLFIMRYFFLVTNNG